MHVHLSSLLAITGQQENKGASKRALPLSDAIAGDNKIMLANSLPNYCMMCIYFNEHNNRHTIVKNAVVFQFILLCFIIYNNNYGNFFFFNIGDSSSA